MAAVRARRRASRPTSLLPSLVGRDARRLDRANSQLYGTETAGQRFIGPPLVAMACDAVLVLFAQEKLRLGGVGFGLLLTVSAAGGLAGSVVAPGLGRQLGTGQLPVVTILLNAACYLTFGLSSTAWTAGVAWAIAGGATGVSNVVGTSLRQTIVPDHLLGRVVSAFRMPSYCAVPADQRRKE